MMWKDLPTPCYVVDEGKIRKNLEILADLEQECGCHILLAQKAFSMYSLYPMIGQYISGTTASGLYEARLGYEEMGKENHVFAPAYKEKDMEELVQICDHIIFNSFAQYEKYKEMCRESAKVRKDKKAVSVGIRINPQCSTQEGHEIYDPCGYASRLGVTEEQFREDLLEGVEGLHFHTLCEQNADDLVTTFQAFEKKFGKYLYRMKWLNKGKLSDRNSEKTDPLYQRNLSGGSLSGAWRSDCFKCRLSCDRSDGHRAQRYGHSDP